MSIVKKELARGNLKTFSPVAVNGAVVSTVDKSVYNSTEYNCSLNGIDFVVVNNRTSLGISHVDLFVDDSKFKSKTELVKFYQEVKARTVVPV